MGYQGMFIYPPIYLHVRVRPGAIILTVPLADHISLTKSRGEILKFSSSSTDDASSRHQWLRGGGKVNSHQAPTYYRQRAKSWSWSVPIDFKSCDVLESVLLGWDPNLDSPTVLEYFILAASLTSGSWDCNQLRVIQSVWGSHLEGKFL